MRAALLTLAALLTACGTTSTSIATGAEQEFLTGGAAPHEPAGEELRWCPPPPDFPNSIMLVVGDTCWVQTVSTQAKCAAYMKEERGRYMAWGGRCWYFRRKKPTREPTSLLTLPEAP